jgi:hypothetical protein
MKKLTLCLLLSVLAITGAVAAPDPGVQPIVSGSTDVVVAKVDSTEHGKIVFSTAEVFKGKSHGRLVLTIGPKMEKLKPGDQCVLCWQGADSTKGTVDADPEYGDPEWFCIPIHTPADKQTLKAWALAKK